MRTVRVEAYCSIESPQKVQKIQPTFQLTATLVAQLTLVLTPATNPKYKIYNRYKITLFNSQNDNVASQFIPSQSVLKLDQVKCSQS